MSSAPQAPMVGVGLLAWTACVERALCALAMKPLCVAVLHRAIILPPRAQCRHNVIHQNVPFSGLRAASLSVAARSLMTKIIAMSINGWSPAYVLLGTGTRVSSSRKVQIWSVSPAAIAGER